MNVRRLAYAGFLVALSVILTRFFTMVLPIGGIGAVRIGLGPVPLMFAGILLGPATAGLAGIAADLVGFAVNPMGGAYLPQFTVISAFYGIIPGAMVRGKCIDRLSLRDLFLICGITQFILGLIVTPLVLFQALKVPILPNVFVRTVSYLVTVPAQAVVLRALIRAWSASGVKAADKPASH